jgi:transposase InsO family protein
MAWQTASVEHQRLEFVSLASLPGASVSALCGRFGISRQTGHLWLRRFAAGETLADRSRRPYSSPRRSDAAIEAAVLAVRDAHPAWGARKLAWRLQQDGVSPPAASTVHAILVRHGRVKPPPGGPAAHLRFERDAPNALWQMDFKGRVRVGDGGFCHPLTVIDDHSRFAVGLAACADQRTATVQAVLVQLLRSHGLPEAFYVDNGSPWGGGVPGQWTRFGVWLAKLGIAVIHARPYHPQGRGKNERFHRTLDAELLDLRRPTDLRDAQRAFDSFRHLYNRQRPHQGIGMAVPASRYRPSRRAFPDRLPEPAYDAGEIVRKVPASKDYISFKGRLWKVPQAFRGETLAIRPRSPDGRYDICFAATTIATIDLAAPHETQD